MAPAAICQWDTVSSQLHRRNSVFKADTSETQTVVRQAPLLIVTNPSLDPVSTLKKMRLLSVLLGGTTSPSRVYAALNDSCCHLGMLGGIRAALPASWKTMTVSNVLMNSCIPSPQVYAVCLRGGQETHQCSLTRKRRTTVCSLRCQKQSRCRNVWLPVARIWKI